MATWLKAFFKADPAEWPVVAYWLGVERTPADVVNEVREVFSKFPWWQTGPVGKGFKGWSTPVRRSMLHMVQELVSTSAFPDLAKLSHKCLGTWQWWIGSALILDQRDLEHMGFQDDVCFQKECREEIIEGYFNVYLIMFPIIE